MAISFHGCNGFSLPGPILPMFRLMQNSSSPFHYRQFFSRDYCLIFFVGSKCSLSTTSLSLKINTFSKKTNVHAKPTTNPNYVDFYPKASIFTSSTISSSKSFSIATLVFSWSQFHSTRVVYLEFWCFALFYSSLIGKRHSLFLARNGKSLLFLSSASKLLLMDFWI